MAHKAKYTSVEQMETRIEEYFNMCEAKEQIPTITGLGVFLGFSSRSSLHEYGVKPAYADTVKKAKYKIEAGLEQRLVTGKPPIGLIFSLKNNFGWADKQEYDLTTNGKDMGVVQLPARTSQEPTDV